LRLLADCFGLKILHGNWEKLKSRFDSEIAGIRIERKREAEERAAREVEEKLKKQQAAEEEKVRERERREVAALQLKMKKIKGKAIKMIQDVLKRMKLEMMSPLILRWNQGAEELRYFRRQVRETAAGQMIEARLKVFRREAFQMALKSLRKGPVAPASYAGALWVLKEGSFFAKATWKQRFLKCDSRRNLSVYKASGSDEAAIQEFDLTGATLEPATDRIILNAGGTKMILGTDAVANGDQEAAEPRINVANIVEIGDIVTKQHIARWGVVIRDVIHYAGIIAVIGEPEDNQTAATTTTTTTTTETSSESS